MTWGLAAPFLFAGTAFKALGGVTFIGTIIAKAIKT